MLLKGNKDIEEKTNNNLICETKRDKFVRLAEGRTNKILKMIDLLGNCANKGAYDYTDEDIRKIFDVIDKELEIARVKFDKGVGKDKKFSL